MSYLTAFDGFQVYAPIELDTSKELITLGCSAQHSSLTYSNPRVLKVSSIGAWRHNFLFYTGDSADFYIWLRALPSNYVIHKGQNLTVVLLNNERVYGCFRICLKVKKSGEVIIWNNIGNPILNELDRLYRMRAMGMSVDTILLKISDINNEKQIKPEHIDTILDKFYYSMVDTNEPLYERYDKALQKLPHWPRTEKVNELVRDLFKRAKELYVQYHDTQE